MCLKKRHEDRTCANPACGITFPPKRGNQLYCEPQCQVNYNNDKKRQDATGRYGLEKRLRACDKRLEILVQSAFYNAGQIEEKVLDAFEIDRTIGTLEEHLDTGLPIRWYHAYGIEQVCAKNRLYTIYYRNK